MKQAEKQAKANEEVIERIRSAVGAGVKIQKIADLSGLSYFRTASIVNSESYRSCTTLNESEVKALNKALDSIKAAL